MVESTAAIVTMRGGGMRCEGAGAAVGATTGRCPDITSDGLDVKQKGGGRGAGGGSSVGMRDVCSPLSHREPQEKLLLIDNPVRDRHLIFGKGIAPPTGIFFNKQPEPQEKIFSHRNPIQKPLFKHDVVSADPFRAFHFRNRHAILRRQKNTAEKPQRDSFFQTYQKLKGNR